MSDYTVNHWNEVQLGTFTGLLESFEPNMPLNPTYTHLVSLLLNATLEIANRRCSQDLRGLALLLRLILDMGHRIAGFYGSGRFSRCCTSSSLTVASLMRR